MSERDDDIRVRPGRIRQQKSASGKAPRFATQVLVAARKAGLTGKGIARGRRGGRSSFGRGIGKGGLGAAQRRVIIKARVVRHMGTQHRTAPLVTHMSYLQRDGVARDGVPPLMFDAAGGAADAKAFAERCAEDRHHFRFIVSPEDAPSMEDLRGFTRDLMAEAQSDLGTELEWIAIDHWNTDNPHVHVLVRGKDDHGADLVIARDYISHGLRARAQELVAVELGPRQAHEIEAGLNRDVTAEHWTGLDAQLQRMAANDGMVDLRGDPEARQGWATRRHLIGRAQWLTRYGLAAEHGAALWQLKPYARATLNELATRNEILNRMARALPEGAERAADSFVINGEKGTPVIGRLLDRGLADELNGTAYAIIDATDGRVHHLTTPSLEATGDAKPGAIVEANPRTERSLIVRSDVALEALVKADAATWLDRILLTKDPPAIIDAGFGAEVKAALEARTDHLLSEGLAGRQNQRLIFAADLLTTLRDRELARTAATITAETSRTFVRAQEGDSVQGRYNRRLDLISGRFALLEATTADGALGFQLVPWRPALDKHLGDAVTGLALPGGGVD